MFGGDGGVVSNGISGRVASRNRRKKVYLDGALKRQRERTVGSGCIETEVEEWSRREKLETWRWGLLLLAVDCDVGNSGEEPAEAEIACKRASQRGGRERRGGSRKVSADRLGVMGAAAALTAAEASRR